jgi:hypothetical protein
LPFGRRHSLLGHPVPPGIPPLLRSAYRHQRHRTMTGFARSAHARYGRGGRPLCPGTGGAPREPGGFPGPPPAASQRRQSCPPAPVPSSIRGSVVTRHPSRVHVLRPPGLPLTCGPRMTRTPSGFPLGFAPARTGPAHARQGGDRLRALAWNYALRHLRHAGPPICEFTRTCATFVSHSRSTVHRATRMPARFSASHVFRAPYTSS